MNLRYLEAASEILAQIDRTQSDNILQAASLMADTISSGGLVYVFGAGHSALPVAEVYPKCGNIVGFQAILDVGLIYFTNVIGSNGISQFTFLERSEGYGQAIMDGYILRNGDTFWAFSQSGVNGLVVETARHARELGLQVVAVTSVAQCASSASRHSTGKRLIDFANVVIDNCVPVGDVTIHLEGLEDPIGPASTMAGVAIANTVVAEVAATLLRRGQKPIINPSLNAPGAAAHVDERMRLALKEFRRRTQRSS
ncbi:MAG: sugar isomerase domain-containing protein [Bacteroidota bacterium]